jgi:hypothetical protein
MLHSSWRSSSSFFPDGRATLMVDNLVRPLLNTLFDSRDEQADRALTATLFDAEDAQIHRLIIEKRVVADPAEEGIDVTVRWDGRENAG